MESSGYRRPGGACPRIDVSVVEDELEAAYDRSFEVTPAFGADGEWDPIGHAYREGLLYAMTLLNTARFEYVVK